MASPSSEPRDDGLPIHHPQKEDHASTLSGVADKSSDPAKEQSLVSEIPATTKVEEITSPSTTLHKNEATIPPPDKSSDPPDQQHLAPKNANENEITPFPMTLEDNEAATTPPPGLEPHAELGATEEEEPPQTSAFYFAPGSSTGLDVDSFHTESDPSDTDSAIGSSLYSSTYSTNSSVYNFVEENGRTYHRFKEGKYYLPNDEIERDRLDLQHHLCNMTFGSSYLAPLDTLEGGLQHVLDIATGTGIWAIEFAEQFPSAVVKGTDLSPIQPDYVPPNCHFEVDDAEDNWVYSHKFDYIHGRMLVTCFQSHLVVFKSAFDFLRPGGYLELQDVCFPFRCADESWEGTAFKNWWHLLMDGATALGKDWYRVPKYKEYLEELGFVDVVERTYSCPIGPWARGEKNKTLGVWGRANILQSLQGLSMAVMTRGLRMTPPEIERLLVDVRKDINKDGREGLHVYAPMYVVYGRKP